MLHRNGNGKMPPEPPQYNNRRRRLSTIIENADRNTAAAGRINYSKISVVSELRAMVYGNNNEKAKNADAYGGNDGEELQQPAYSITGAKNRKNNDGHWMDVEYGRPPAQTHLDRFHRNLPAPNRKPTTRVVHEARAVRPMNLSAPLALMHTDKRNAKMLEIFRESLASRIRTERSLVREFLAEFLGTFVLLLIGVSANVQAAASPGGNVISAQFAWGFGLAFGVYLAINVSGAHLNPAISFSTLVTGDLSLTRFFLYVLAQLLGAFVGTAVAFFGHYDDIQKLDNGTRQVFGTRGTAGLLTTFPAEHMTRMGAFLDQIIGTAILAAVVALLADRKHRISTSTVPLLAGLTLTAIAMTYGANAGFAVNPARDFAPRLFALCVGYGTAVFSAANYYFWMPIIGQLIGALAGTLAYKLFVGIHGLSERVEITGGAPYPRDDRGYKVCQINDQMAMTTEDEVGVIQADLSGDDTFKTPSISVRRNENNDIDEESITPKESTNRPACVPYTAPIWAATPSLSDDLFNFHIEVIKNGTIIDVLRLGELSRGESSFVSVGRFAPCEIQLDHPSVSRYHCVLQYGRIAGQYGWSLYDLASTHGTRLNKQRVKARAYVPLRPGYVIQFANSSRIFAFCGKDEDDNVDEKSAGSSPVAGASSTSASMMTAAKEAGRNDAIEAGDVKFYEKDPLGALDKYFEREGLPMSFQYAKAERRAGEWSCSIELADLPEADALVSGTGVTRKLAQVACALAACRRLYAAGALVVASSWNKRATYAENDYYDSDEDTYLDRTGQIEAQRAKRRRRCEALADGSTGGASRTHDELLRELADTEEKERNTNAEIKRMLGKNSYTDDDGNLVSTSTNFSMRMAISQMRAKQRRFTAECEQLRRLVELTKPRRLDDIFAAGAKSSAQPGADDDTENAKRNGLLVTGEESKRHDVTAEIEPVNDDDDDVMADDETPKRQPEDAAEQFGAKEFFSRQMDDLKGEEDEAEEQLANRTSGERLYKTVAPPPPAAIVAHASSTHVAAVILPKYGLITREEARVKAPTLVKRRVVHQRGDGQFDDETETAMVGQLKKTKTKLSADYSDTKSDDYVTWMPPQGQSGDGTTPLNKKFQSRY